MKTQSQKVSSKMIEKYLNFMNEWRVLDEYYRKLQKEHEVSTMTSGAMVSLGMVKKIGERRYTKWIFQDPLKPFEPIHARRVILKSRELYRTINLRRTKDLNRKTKTKTSNNNLIKTNPMETIIDVTQERINKLESEIKNFKEIVSERTYEKNNLELYEKNIMEYMRSMDELRLTTNQHDAAIKSLQAAHKPKPKWYTRFKFRNPIKFQSPIIKT